MLNSEESRQRSHKATTQQAPIKAWTGHPYPVYKDSGVKWLGKVPEHWEVRHLGAFGRFLKGSGGTKADETKEGVPCIRYGDLYTRHQFHITESKTCIAPHRVAAYTPISYGDVLFAGSGETLEEIGKSAVNLIRGPTVCGGDVIIFRPTLELDAEFIGWSADCRQAASQKAQMGKGITVMHIYSNDLKYLTVALPPLSEQRAIAHFLDDANKRIQRHIHAKEKLIKLLEEQKQVIIHQAVTGQIDVRTGKAYPAYKDSGVEWLGEVPEHWEVRRSRRVFKPRTELARPDDIQLSATQAYGVIEQADYEKKIGRKVTRILRHLDQRRHVEVDDFVISMRSFQGGLERAWRSGCIRSSYIVLQPTQALIVGYFGYLFKSPGYIAALQSTANFIRDGQDLNFENFRQVDLPFPPIKEQQKIAEAVDQMTTHIALSIESTRRQISLFHEYRTRLIADVVTGKLDVREAAAALPEKEPPTGGDNCQDGMAFAVQVQSRCP